MQDVRTLGKGYTTLYINTFKVRSNSAAAAFHRALLCVLNT
jgi:hypothetical protein